MTDRSRRVGAHLVLQVHQPLRAMLQAAVSGTTPARIQERPQVRRAGDPLDVTEVPMPGSGRVQMVDPRPGTVSVDYAATIRGAANSPAVTETERITCVRGSVRSSAVDPFAESREWIVGFDILQCADLDQAIAIAAEHPMAARGRLELRPFWPFDESAGDDASA